MVIVYVGVTQRKYVQLPFLDPYNPVPRGAYVLFTVYNYTDDRPSNFVHRKAGRGHV